MNGKKIIPDSCFDHLSTWYESYTESYRSGDRQLEDAIQLKYDHTLRVCHEIRELCSSLSLDRNTTVLAQAAALLHDISRFEQFKQFRTFSDVSSFNHAEMSVEIITASGLLHEFTVTDTTTVLTAIRYHNAAALPETIDRNSRFVCKLLRDADKLDIYKIVLDYYVNPNAQRKSTVQVDISDGTSVSAEVCGLISRGETVPYEKIRNVADFKLIQAGWVFDLNFPHSFRCVHSRGYLNDLQQQLPVTPEIENVFNIIRHHLVSRLQ